jgi:diadenosine tetraphosphate (Ap4A) HIT family hydrolase
VAAQCIFCRIAAGEIPAQEVYRDDLVFAIEDANPQAPSHLLVMPLAHYENVADLARSGDGMLMAKIFEVAADLGAKRGGADGFRLVVNTGSYGGQTVGHLHVHALAGREMSWPPG